jgi:hypothetical protein
MGGTEKKSQLLQICLTPLTLWGRVLQKLPITELIETEGSLPCL